jgi:hypothetical protein
MNSATGVGCRGILATDRSLARFLGVVAFPVRLTAHLTFDVRGGPLAGRPLDGAVRRTRLSKEMTGTRRRDRRERPAWPP